MIEEGIYTYPIMQNLYVFKGLIAALLLKDILQNCFSLV